MEGCRQLTSLADQWTTIVQGQNAADTAGNGAAALKLDLARLEGLAFSLLGLPSVEVRSLSICTLLPVPFADEYPPHFLENRSHL